jgi:glycosyltransferase involved in cell wall biosynthesis
MRICVPIDYGINANVTSLNVISKNLFLELGKIMNSRKNFTVTGTLLSNLGIGDINLHYDCTLIPNMGGFRFPPSTNNVKKLYIGLVGIDEVVLGEEVYMTKSDWEFNKPIIKKEVKKWKKYIDRIEKIQVSTIAEQKQMEEFLDIPKNKMVVIPYGVNHNIFKPARDKNDTRRKILSKLFLKNSPYFLHVGERNWKRKNLKRIIEAFTNAKQKGITQNLIIVGRFSQDIVEFSNNKPGIMMIGFVPDEDLVELYKGADGLINPSIHEGFGIPLLESIACGTPVLTSNEYSPPELIKDGGITVNARDVEEITKKMIELAKDDELRLELSKNALKRSMEFTWEKFAEGMLDMMNVNEKSIPSWISKLDMINMNEKSKNLKFEKNFTPAYNRTITTIAQLHTQKNFTSELLQFDYKLITDWIRNWGFDDNEWKYYTLPFKEHMMKIEK